MNTINTIKGKQLYKGFSEIADEYVIDYLSQWTFDHPLLVSMNTYNKMHRLQKSLFRVICYFSKNYHNYRDLMPLSDRVSEIIELCKDKPYYPGTYRTDFVINENNDIKLIEITCRFALNGLFVSGFFNRMGERYLIANPEIKAIENYTSFFDYFVGLFREADHICLLKGPFDNNESKYAVPIFEKAGFDVKVIKAEEIPNNIHLLSKGILISELNQDDWCNLPNEIIMKLIDGNLINDPRTIFLIHDKRFFSFLCDEIFLSNVLTEEESEEFLAHVVPTYRPDQRPDLWENARLNKDNWILKPFAQGRSIDVFAGCVTEQEDWAKLFSESKSTKMVLQPFIRQRHFPGEINGKSYNDYAAGILLYFNDLFFGPGVFRTSSFPVTNKVDDRKFIPMVVESISAANELNWI
jgi:hypothetical protein